MRGTILNTDEFGEFGSTAVVLTMTVNATEAQRILDDFGNLNDDEFAYATRMLRVWLTVIADRAPQKRVDRINTDGRYPMDLPLKKPEPSDA
jgi:hypothetical protein